MTHLIKVRAWDKKHKEWVPPEIVELWAIHTLSEESELHEYSFWIGENDKNNKEIYEGDIVSLWYEEGFFKGTVKGEIIWSDYTLQYMIDFPDAGFSVPIASLDWNFSEVEVIGNTYENEDLLSGS